MRDVLLRQLLQNGGLASVVQAEHQHAGLLVALLELAQHRELAKRRVGTVSCSKVLEKPILPPSSEAEKKSCQGTPHGKRHFVKAKCIQTYKPHRELIK